MKNGSTTITQTKGNHGDHASTSTAKPNIHGKELMCIWWDQLGIVYYELLKSNETITGTLYWTQLMRLSRVLKEKRAHYYSRHDKIILLHDNARPHVAASIKTLETLTWEVLSHPSYSPDIALSDYHLFRSMTHGPSEQHFTSYEDTKNCIDSLWIASEDEAFFRRSIHMLPERCEKVVASDGHYFE